eukprot:5597663-Prymnesium_polylepis.2
MVNSGQIDSVEALRNVGDKDIEIQRIDEVARVELAHHAQCVLQKLAHVEVGKKVHPHDTVCLLQICQRTQRVVRKHALLGVGVPDCAGDAHATRSDDFLVPAVAQHLRVESRHIFDRHACKKKAAAVVLFHGRSPLDAVENRCERHGSDAELVVVTSELV